jgi:hypothetical protein
MIPRGFRVSLTIAALGAASLRANGEALNKIGQNGRYAGQFHWIHNLAADSRGNIYTAEVDTGKRAQKFRRTN